MLRKKAIVVDPGLTSSSSALPEVALPEVVISDFEENSSNNNNNNNSISTGGRNSAAESDEGNSGKKKAPAAAILLQGVVDSWGAIHQLLNIILQLRILVLLLVSTLPYVVKVKNYC
jgi:hypothetical protein